MTEQTLYKLTDQDGYTRRGESNEMRWCAGAILEASGDASQDLCSDGWLHFYESPLLAVLLNPIHANIAKPRLWECRGIVGKRDGQLKCGARKAAVMRELLPLPAFTAEQHVYFAILYGRAVCAGAAWNRWADDWVSGKDRTVQAARAAWAARAAAAWAARAAAVWAAAAARAAAAWAATSAARAGAEIVDLSVLAEQAYVWNSGTAVRP